ncbi:hypothetical protein [Hymenobacter coccineus]|uniref:Phytase-like domain-containing protein n=1 Tax=Hymenobacter coccineus TaxID=1908235 RepID=A0A1G1TE80_9BACT|nr:hypothetical protein [Hymenobacter coccineus]OGX89160.1 hypothetical protein BEN49_09480 [Hymenobacter coccineus]
MKSSLFLPASLALLLTAAACSQAQNDQAATQTDATQQTGPEQGQQAGGKKKKDKGGDRRKDKDAAAQIPGLRQVGSLKGVVSESSGLCPADQPGTYFSFGDEGNDATLYRISATGQLQGTLSLGTNNSDWESLSRDDQGNYFVGDCGNNENDRRNLVIHRFRPEQPRQVADIKFKYPDQTAFPPEKKKARNFDCEASLWHGGKVWLFSKDRGTDATSKVYSVPDQPGSYTAQLVTKLAIPGQVTDAALRPDGHRLVLLGRGELFVLDGNSWDEILKATPRQVSLAGAGQTEGAVFKDANTLLISTEQGSFYEFTLPFSLRLYDCSLTL